MGGMEQCWSRVWWQWCCGWEVVFVAGCKGASGLQCTPPSPRRAAFATVHAALNPNRHSMSAVQCLPRSGRRMLPATRSVTFAFGRRRRRRTVWQSPACVFVVRIRHRLADTCTPRGPTPPLQHAAELPLRHCTEPLPCCELAFFPVGVSHMQDETGLQQRHHPHVTYL